MNTKQLIEQAIALPVETRVRVVDALLLSLNATQPEIDAQWVIEAKCRLLELRSDQIETVPGETVFEHVRNRFGR